MTRHKAQIITNRFEGGNLRSESCNAWNKLDCPHRSQSGKKKKKLNIYFKSVIQNYRLSSRGKLTPIQLRDTHSYYAFKVTWLYYCGKVTLCFFRQREDGWGQDAFLLHWALCDSLHILSQLAHMYIVDYEERNRWCSQTIFPTCLLKKN